MFAVISIESNKTSLERLAPNAEMQDVKKIIDKIGVDNAKGILSWSMSLDRKTVYCKVCRGSFSYMITITLISSVGLDNLCLEKFDLDL